MSKNNAKMVQRKMADQKQRFGIRKLSIGVASVLLGTLFYMQSGTVYADVNPTASAGNDGINVVNENSSTSSSAVGSSTSDSASSSSSVSSAGDATNSIDTHQVSASPVESATGKANNNAAIAGREQGNSVPTSHVNAGDDETVKNENSNLDYHPTQVPNSHVALEKSVAGSGSVDSRVAALFQPVLAMKAETETPVAKPAVDSEAPKRETVDSTWTLHYVNQADHKQELKDPTVITMQYERTNVPQSDGTTKYGDWSYVSGSFKQTGTPITVNDSDNPVKKDNVDKNGENMDVFTITAMYPTIAGYDFHNGINGARLSDNLRNNDRQADSMSKDFYAEYDVAKPTRETVDSKWIIHYVNQADHKQELKDPTVITMQYARTNTPQSDGTTKYGDWSYVPGSFKQTGTPITVKDSNNPVKQDNVDKNGENFDVFTITAMYPTVAGYGFYNGINGTRLRDNLVNDNRQADTMSKDFYAEYDVAKPTQETVDSQWTIHYVNSADHQQELKAPTVITMQYTRTNTPQSDGTVQYGDWSYVPGSFKQTGTLVEVNGSDNPVKEDNVNNNGKNEDVFSIIVKHPNITGYDFHNGTNGVRLSDHLLNNESNDEIQAPTMSKDGYVEYDVAKERSVAVKFVDDESFDPDSSDGKTQVGQALTLTGRDGDTVKVNVTVPDKYQLSNGQQLPTTYTFTAGSGDVTIHLVHKVVQREATINFQLMLMTFVDFGDNSYEPVVVTQARWKQLEEEAKDGDGPVSPDGVTPFTEVGTLTGHVGYDLVDEEAVSFGDDWTSLNLGSRTYQLPNGTDVVNGILDDSDDTTGEKLKEYYLNDYQMMNPNKPLDPDYVNRPWHGYLSVNATNNTQTPGSWDVIRSGLQAGLAGDESNMLAKATGDRAATAVKMANKTIDVNWLQDNLGFGARDFSEKDGRLQAQTIWKAFGVYIPYVEKTATRTIKVTTSDGKTTTVKQTATLAKQVEFGKDAHPAWTTGEWENYEVPAIPGYTASQTNVAKETVTGETEDQTVNITYTANSQTTTVIYQAEDGTPVHTTTVKGQTGQTVKVSNEVPVGWHVVNGTVPSEITFGPNGTPKTVVTIAHSHATVTPDAPKTTSDKLPDNPAKTYPGGVSHDDLNKTITRTIKVTTPDGQTKTIEQTSKLTRTADVDEVTGEVKYSDWTTGEWASYDVPNVPGYTASQSHVAQQAVTDATEDQTIEITYTANEHQISVEYVDNATGKILKTDHVSGKTGQTVSITPHVPDGWELVSDQSVSSKVTLGADGAPVTVIKVQPQERSIAVKFVDDQSDKRQVGQAITVTGRDGGTVDLNLTVPDKYQLANGQQLPTTYTFKKGSGDLTIHLVHQVVQREATVDVQLRVITTVDIDGYPVLAVTQTRWKQMDNKIKDSKDFNSDKVFPSVEVGTLTGHVGYDLVDNQVVSFNDDWTSLNLGGQTYQMPDGTEVVNGMLIDSESSWGKTLKEQYLKYSPDTDPDYVNQAWHGYLSVNKTNEIASDFTSNELQAGLVGNEPNKLAKVIGDQAATAVKIANKTIDSNWLKDNFDTSEFSEQNGRLQGSAKFDVMGFYIPYVEKTATRTINVTTPDGKTTAVKQTATLAKQVTEQEDAHPDWTTGEWASYDVPTIPGYTASQSNVNKETVTGETKDQTVNITYTANKQSTTIKYVDDKGQTIHTTNVNGVTNQTVKVPSEVPTGWTITKGEVPSEITFGADGHESVVITVGHQHVTVDPDHPQNNGTKLPDNPAKTFEGVEANDLNKIITRTIKVTTPDGKTTTAKQTAKLTRTADVDEVTGEVTYGNWTTGEWSAYNAPSVAGYTPSQTAVAKESVTATSNDTTVEITYQPMQHQISVEYVDDDHGKVVKTDQVPGKTDQTITVTPSAPANYDLVDNGSRTYTVTSDNAQAVQIHVKHHQVTTSESKTVTRTINVHTPHAGTKVIKQAAELTRKVTTDQVTGEKTYGDWTTGQWEAYTVATIPGYTPSINEVPNTNVDGSSKNQTVDVTYTADAQKVEIVYVDDAKDGAVVKTDQIAGKTDETVKVTPDVPAGYQVVSEVPGSYTMTADGHQAITVHLVHQMKTTSEDKTATRTINVHTPHDGVKTVKQTADLTRDVTTDQVTGEKTYGDWTTGQWKAYTPEAISGYTPSTNEVSSANIDGDSTDQTVDITYAADPQKVEIVYVDDAKDGAVVKTDQIAGKTDETVKVTPDVPAGYQVVSEVPGSYTMTADGHQAITVHLVHQMKTTSEDKTATRTINVRTPHDGTTVFKQTVDLSRDVTTDQVTGDKTYGDWSTTEWTHYDVPVVAGYTPSIKQVAQQVVDGTTTDQTVNVTYTANAQTTHVNYVDGDGNVVHTTTITGKTDQTVKVPNETPAGWKIVGESVQTEITFGPDGHADATVAVDHQHVTVTPDDPKTPADKLPNNPGKTYPDGVGHDDLNRTVTRTIKVVTPDRQTETVAQKVQLTRTADIDEVTGKVTYGKWTTGEWSRYEVPSVPGYTASQSEVPAVNVTDTTKDQMLTLTYTANDQTTHVNYVDGDGKTVHVTTITGKTDQTVKVLNEVPTGWTITDGQVPAEITFGPDGHADVAVTVGHQHVTVTPDQPKIPSDKLPNNPGKTYPAGVGHDDLNKTITRTIKVTTPDGKTQTTVQKVQLTRTADVDEVTGKVTYGKWTTGEWANYTVPAVPGYTASQSDVPATKVTSDTKNQTVTVTYTANAQTTTINYVDGDGKVVHTTTVTGHTDQTVKVPNETPAGWTIADGQVPTEITFGPNGHDNVTVTVGHKHVAVTPDKAKTNGTQLPDNPSQTFHGVGHDDLNKTIVRTIEVTVPTGKTKTVKQTVKLTRSADVDEVTGEVTYGKWTTSTWSSYNVPAVPGYTPSQAVVDEVAVNADMANQTVKITYTANDQTTHINYVDGDGEVVHTTTIKGHTDQTVKVPNETPAGWTIIAGQVPSEVTFGADGHADVQITVDHRHITVTPDDLKTDGTKLPDNPSLTFQGVEHDDLNRTVTRTIKVTTPDGKTQTVAQKVQSTRSADVDEATGEVTYGDWSTGAWSSYTVPTVPGYTASQVTVPATKVTAETADQTVAITYTANDQTTHINYVDGNGKIVRTTTITGKTDQTVKVLNEVPTGWTITDGQVPSEVIFGANGYDDVTVTVDHQHVTVTPDKAKTNGTQLPDNSSKTFHGVAETDLNKVVTRTIEVAVPTGKTKTVKQTAKLTRTADVDEVTGEVTYGKWTTGTWSSYTVPIVAGYNPSQAVVTEVAVDANTSDQTVKITYTADSHTTHINYVDKDGNVVHATTVAGTTDQTVKVPNEVPTGWKVTGESVPTEITFGPDGHADVTVTVDHLHVTMTPDQPRENDTKLPNTISKSTQSTQTASQNISIRTSQTSTPQTTNDVHESQLPQTTNDVHESQLPQATTDDHESQLPQTGNKSDSKLELIGLIGIAFAGLFGFGTRRKKRD